MIQSLEAHKKTKCRTMKSLRFPILLGKAVAAVHKNANTRQQEQQKQGQTWELVIFHVPSQCCFQWFVCLTSSGIMHEVLFPWGRGEVLEWLCFSAWFESLTRPFWLSAMFGMKGEEGICSRTLTVNCAVYWLRYSLWSVAVPLSRLSVGNEDFPSQNVQKCEEYDRAPSLT